MKKLMKKLSIYYIAGVFAFSPLLFLIMYITYSEKVMAPILLILLFVSTYFIFVEEE